MLAVRRTAVGKHVSAAPRVSVVVPVYNASAFLAETIESVRSQTYPGWELVLCDDGSTDDSAEIARRYADLDPERIRCVAHPGGANLGQSASRNLAIRHARGEFISLLDADDLYLPQRLEEQVAILDARPEADAIYGPTNMWYGWTGVPGDAARDTTFAMGIPSDTLLAPGELLVGALRREMQMPTPSAMILRAHAVERVGGFVDEYRDVYEDQVFIAKLTLASSILFVDRRWDLYRQHPDSVYALAKREGMRMSRLRFLTWLEGYLSQTPFADDARLRQALQAALRRSRHPRVFEVIDGARAALRSVASKSR